MRETSCTILALFLLFQSAVSYAQTENFEKGIEAIQADLYDEAMVCFIKVVENERFEISGKDLSMAYAYLAMIRTANLEKDLSHDDFYTIAHNQGSIHLSVHAMVRAVEFKSSSSKSLIASSKNKLIDISTQVLNAIGDSLLYYDKNEQNQAAAFLANLAIKQFGELEHIAIDNWHIYDILGLAHYHLGEMDKSMAQFAKAREQFATLDKQPISRFHLKNYILSSDYYYLEAKNAKEAYKISEAGSTYTSVLISALGDDKMKDIIRLSKIQNRFRRYMTRIDESGG